MSKIKSAKYYYGTHKESSRQRGIPFRFTYERWVRWWEENLGPDWMAMRGHRDGQYVMARRKDKGPYAPWNVECITCNQNHSDTAKNDTSTYGSKNPNARLNEKIAREIYVSTVAEEAALSKKYDLPFRYILNIKQRKIWARATADLPKPKLSGFRYPKGAGHPNAVLTPEIVKQIYLAEGSIASITKRFGIKAVSTVRGIRIRNSWRSVTEGLGPSPYQWGQGKRTDLDR
jgi:hypothetical protein